MKKMLIVVPVLTLAFSIATAASGGAVGAALVTDGVSNWADLWGGVMDGTGKGLSYLGNTIG